MLASAVVRRLLICALMICGCGPSGTPDGGTTGAYSLSAVGAATVGLKYGDTHMLTVRYVDDMGRPLSDVVHFAIFGDPRGSALSSDRAMSGADGTAMVNLTAGAAEAQFTVVATATNAPDLSFDISISKFDFLELDVALDAADLELTQAPTLQALLYDDHTCAMLSPIGAPPIARRTASATGTTELLPFQQLLHVTFAAVGRALDAGGNVLAWGCVDLPADQLAKSRALMVPVPLTRLTQSVVGVWALDGKLPLVVPDATTRPWDDLARCPNAPAQQILDGIAQVLVTPPPLFVDARAPADSSGCRPSTVDGSPSLDATLEELLTRPGSPSSALPAVIADLHTLLGAVEVTSQLTLVELGATGSGTLVAGHQLTSARFTSAGGARSMAYDLASTGAPILDEEGLAASFNSGVLSLGSQGFTLRLPSLWRHAVGDLALAPRGLPADSRGYLAAIVGVVTRGPSTRRLMGCDAISDLVCAPASAPACDVGAACVASLDALATRLDATFTTANGLDYSLAGAAAVTSHGSTVTADSLVNGHFDVTLSLAPGTTLSATETWSGQRVR